MLHSLSQGPGYCFPPCVSARHRTPLPLVWKLQEHDVWEGGSSQRPAHQLLGIRGWRWREGNTPGAMGGVSLGVIGTSEDCSKGVFGSVGCVARGLRVCASQILLSVCISTVFRRCHQGTVSCTKNL